MVKIQRDSATQQLNDGFQFEYPLAITDFNGKFPKNMEVFICSYMTIISKWWTSQCFDSEGRIPFLQNPGGRCSISSWTAPTRGQLIVMREHDYPLVI